MESGQPINILNGYDADGIGGANDRPGYNASGILNTRAVPSATSPTGYINPDNNNQPISAATAMYIAFPSCTSTVPCPTGDLGRDTYRYPIQNDLDADLTKVIKIRESMQLQFRGEFYNVFTHRQFGITSASAFDQNAVVTMGATVATTPAGHFLNPGYADGGSRVLKFQAKFVF